MTTGQPWWHDAVVYQVYIRSFCDSDGDGIGDLPGIRSRLPYLAELGVDALWITPFYRSPMHDHGYDVADYCDVDPLFGTLGDFDAVVTDAHALGLRVIVDVVPNHTSNEHPWFLDAVSGPDAEHRDWYVFVDPGPDGRPPNNWESVFGGPAWALELSGRQLYLHLFDRSQPDLDWRNPAVHAAFEDVLRFWLDRGVDGFRIDVAHGLYKDAELRDNVAPSAVIAGTEHLNSVGAGRVWDQPETLEVWREWRRVLDGYPDRTMVGEVFLYDMDRVSQYVGRDRLHQSFNFLVAGTPFEAAAWRRIVGDSLRHFLRDGTTPTWVLSNHDLVRHATRFGSGEVGRRRGRAATALLLGLPGAPYIYQGEELGLEQSDVPARDRQDPIWLRSGIVGRDGCRTPMPWRNEPAGWGFTSGSPWLPFDTQAASRNAEVQEADPTSTLRFYRQALRVRRELSTRLIDDVAWLDSPDEVVALARGMNDGERLLLLMNCGTSPLHIDVGGPASPVLTSGTTPAIAGSTVTVPAETTVWLTGLASGPLGRNTH